jgi:formamidopyrimidine-DNA glycosylase
MPELPEVENLRLGLEKNILNQKILGVQVYKPKLVSGKGTLRKSSEKKRFEFIKGIIGEKIVEIERRAKNLVFKLSHEKTILAHLKMSGQFVYLPKSNKLKPISGGHPIEISETTLPNKHSHIIFYLDKGTHSLTHSLTLTRRRPHTPAYPGYNPQNPPMIASRQHQQAAKMIPPPMN